MIQKHISLPEDLDQQIRERVKHLNASEERVIQELIEEGLKSSTRDRFSVLDSIRAKNPGLDPERVERDVTAVVKAVRQELYDKNRTQLKAVVDTNLFVSGLIIKRGNPYDLLETVLQSLAKPRKLLRKPIE